MKVTFNKTVDAASVLADVKVAGTLKTGVTASVTPLGTATANVLKSAKVEGKTLTLTLTTAISGENNVIIDGLKTAAGEKVARYSEVVKFAADKVAPTVVGTEQVSSTTAKVEFSEALSTLGTVSFKTKDGKEIDANTVSEVTPFASGDTSVTFNLSAAKVVGATDVIADGTEVVVTFVGAQDIALNLINPNPATATIKKVAADKVAPTVSSVTQTGAKEITVKFDKAVKTLTTTDNASDFKVGTTVATGVEKVSDTEYKITFDAPLEGIKEVKIAKEAITNVDGTEGVEFTKLVTFTKDAVAPKATSKVVTVNGVEFLELTFDKDVELAATAKVSLEGTVTEDYITTTVDAVDGTVEYANIDKETKKPTNKKVVLVGLENVKKQATYNLTVTPTGITSASDVAVVAFETSFTRGEDKPVTPPVELSEEVVSGVAVTQNGTNADEVKVTFSFNAGQKLDGASATNIANYSIANAEIESATLAAANAAGTEQVVTLKLKKNSNSFTGVRNATVKNVKLVNSKAVMEEKSVITDELAENVRATVLSAKITAANQITVTFSEKLNSIDKLAFDVKAGTDKVALDGAGTVLGTDNTTAVITLASDLTAEQLAKAITVESAKTADGKVAATYVIKDTKDNVSDDFAAITVVKP